MTLQASGSFEVKLAPLEPYNQDTDAGLGRLSIDKQFFGDLEATSRGEMLSAGTPAQGSAGYVAIERVAGTLHGRSGSFALQHSSTMDAETMEQSILVTPGSGTGELTGLAGTMRILVEDGAHSYELDYTVPEEP